MHAGWREVETKRSPIQRSLRQIMDTNDEMMNSAGHGISGCCGPTVSFGSNAGQSIVAAAQHKKIYCKASAYQ
jgi:hypothetical protein